MEMNEDFIDVYIDTDTTSGFIGYGKMLKKSLTEEENTTLDTDEKMSIVVSQHLNIPIEEKKLVYYWYLFKGLFRK